MSLTLLGLLLCHLREHLQLVQLQALVLATQLLDRGQETLRIEQPRDVHHLGDVQRVVDPVVQLHAAVLQVGAPRSQRPRRREAELHPPHREFLCEQAICQVFHDLAHGQLALEAEHQLLQATPHLVDEAVHVLALLQEDELVGALLLLAHGAAHVVGRKLLLLHLFKNLGTYLLRDGHGTLRVFVLAATTAACSEARQAQQHFECLDALHRAEVDLGIRVHAEEEGRLRRHRLDVLDILLVGTGWRRGPRQFAIRIRDHLELIQKLVLHEIQQVLGAHDAVPIVHDVAAIHDVAEDVPQVVPRNLDRGRALKVVVQHLSGVAEIACREGVLHVVAHGAKLFALQHDRVPVAEREQDRLHLSITVLEVLLAEERERPAQVGKHALRRLVGQLDRSFQDTDRNTLARVSRQEHPEVWVAVLDREHVQLLLELDAPLRHQVDVLQHDPVPLPVSDVQLCHRDDILTLAHGNVPIVGATLQVAQLLAHGLHFLHGVCARR
mmetsp:Transcript_9979/g.26011  ORF Transcript_9979/g.26011 Transcript_9979/m.26011 type:complete len:497 (+) Transcript_9979:380-1870(+)